MTSSPPPVTTSVRLSVASLELQAEFLRGETRARPQKTPPPSHLSVSFSFYFPERQNKFASLCDSDDSSVFSATPPSSPNPSPVSSSSSSPCYDRRQTLSLSSPELLSELKESRTRTLRHVPAHTGLTTVFSGRGGPGRQTYGPTHSTRPANRRTLH
ncbi:hypothetical protein JOB18_015437 [Solea senegalensis]|uniref:Uncharacterized protein n=1 Tax=Solea senegalensis TaxID=28829 RepID=A0AAV6QW70_SOLSE|nr:hypothetical protein JOB18_015437 [Solea senegalensis]